MATVSGTTFFGGKVPPAPAPTQTQAAPQVSSDNIWQSVVSAGKNITNAVGQDLYDRSNKVADIQARTDTSAPEKALQTFGQGAGAAANALEVTASQVPGIKQATSAIGTGINWLTTSELSPIKHLGDLIGQSHALQEAVHLYDTDKNFRDTIDGVANTARLGGDVSAVVDGVNYASNVTNKIVSNVKARTASVPAPSPMVSAAAPKNLANAGNVARDIMPTTERFVNTEVTKALDLTQGDVKNISLSTGNEVGQFMAEKNLIGSNMEETNKLLNDYYKSNYTTVRSEIGKVTKIFDKNELPAYKESLLELKKQISDVPGLHDENFTVDSLLTKNKFTLNEVQKAKELMDEHFSLYKATGDVKEGVAKSGLSNLRKELQTFIEEKVQKATGADIKELNNNVSTARSIQDAIETRSTRGMTRATITAGDVVTLLSGTAAGGPLAGVAAVIIKKIYQSPSFKLKLSKFLDGLSDAKKMKVQQELQAGQVPQEITNLQSSTESSASNTNPRAAITPSANLPKSDMPGIESQTPPKASLLDKARQVGSFIKNNINDKRGFVKIGKGGDIPFDDLATMRDFTDYVNGAYKPANPTDLELAAQRIADKYGIAKSTNGNKALANSFAQELERRKFMQGPKRDDEGRFSK